MKAFLAALAALVIITVGARQLLMLADFSADAATASSENVRIHD